MPTPTKGPRLGGSATHERTILGNLASQLFEHGAVVTTEAKAKRVRPLAERLIAKAKKGDLHNRRIVRRTITDTSVLHTLFTEVAPLMENRDGGFTRIIKIGPRKGDNAPMARIELVTEPVAPKVKSDKATTSGSSDDLKAAMAASEEAREESASDADAAQADMDAAAAPADDATTQEATVDENKDASVDSDAEVEAAKAADVSGTKPQEDEAQAAATDEGEDATDAK